LRILPLGFFGRASVKTTYLGRLWPASAARTWAYTSSVDSVAPGFGTMTATTASIQPDAEHGCLRDAVEEVERLFDFSGSDVLTTGLDHVLLAVDDGEVTVFVDYAEVSGVKSSVTEGDGGLGLVPEVAERGVWAAMHDLAYLAWSPTRCCARRPRESRH
jgi:hypothetical protein